MNFDDLKDQVIERAQTLWAQIQDSSTYNSIREKYDTQPANIQKFINFGGLGAICFMLFLIPYSFISSSSEYIQFYNEEREAIRGLLKASQLPDPSKFLLPKLSVAGLQGKVQMIVNQANLTEDQKGPISALTGGSNLAPPSVNQEGVKVSLMSLNLNQILDIGNRIQGLARQNNVKLMDMSIVESPNDKNYFDVTYSVISFGVDIPESEGGDEAAGGKPPRGRAMDRFRRNRKGK